MTTRYSDEQVIEALYAIDPSSLDYQQWLEVGQALHEGGFPSSSWRDWSAQDSERFNERDFHKKWDTFGFQAGSPVTIGTVIKMARDAGWKPKSDVGDWVVYDWDSVIGVDKPQPIADGTIAAGNTLEPYDSDMSGVDQAKAYIEALFEQDEHICFVTKAEYDEKRDKWKPAGRGTCHMTAGEVVSQIEKWGKFEDALGTYTEDAGIWCCFNPLDGDGRNNTNVTAFRYVLVESDETDPAVCKSVYEQLNLPIAAMVFSGLKSLHAIVRVDAHDLAEYNSRREVIYKACEDNGLAVDKANKNPARLSRLPGAKRGDKTQFLVSLAHGAADYEEWLEWYEAANDDLPDCENLSDMMGDNLPPLAKELIAGVLRVRHKMLISGASKAGKSFLLINLCIALAEGRSWMGFKCRQSKVLYVNLELDAPSCWHRFADVYKALGIKPEFAENINVWNLRGKSQPMNKLLPKLVRRGRDTGSEVIVIDPIYKIMTGDENSASDMAAFANAFDRLALEVGCSVIYCHHHSKGFQDGKKSIDRASGSGVFGRDPDAILDLIELEPDESAKTKHVGNVMCAKVGEFMVDNGLEVVWRSATDERDRVIAGFAKLKAKEVIAECKPELSDEFEQMVKKVENAQPTAWRCEGTLREFPSFAPVSMWFDYPLHVEDKALSDTPEMGEKQTKGKSGGNGSGGGRKASKENEEDKKNTAIAEAVACCEENGIAPTKKNVLDKWPSKYSKIKPAAATFDDWMKPSKNGWCEWYSSQDDGGNHNTPGTVKRREHKEEWE